MREFEFVLCFFEGLFVILGFSGICDIKFVFFGVFEFARFCFLSAESSTGDVFALSLLDDFLVVLGLQQIVEMMKTAIHVQGTHALVEEFAGVRVGGFVELGTGVGFVDGLSRVRCRGFELSFSGVWQEGSTHEVVT